MEMGLGKTAVALSWLHLHPEIKPVIVVCTSSLKLNWEREVHLWMNDVLPSVHILYGKNGKGLPKADLYIVNYDILQAWLPELLKIAPKAIVCDEATAIKERTAQRTKAVKELCKGVPHVLMLTGTPIVNRPAEAFNMLNIISPARFPSFFHYAKEFCGAFRSRWGWDFSGASNLDKLHEKLQHVMVRRLKSEVLQDLPEKRRAIVPLEIVNRKEYRRAEEDFVGWLRDKGDKVRAESASRAEALVSIEGLKQLTISGKLETCLDWIADFLETGEKLIVFATHKRTIDAVMQRFGELAVKVDGSVTGEDRQLAVDRFQTDTSVRLFVGNIQAAGVGITLTAASNVAFLELGWSPGIHEQAEDRCILEGQWILTPDGWRLIENIVVGDLVIGGDGLLHRVTDKSVRLAKGSHSFNSKDIAEITVRGWNRPISVTTDHRILTTQGWKEARDIKPRDRLCMPKATEFAPVSNIPVEEKHRYSPIFQTPEQSIFGSYYSTQRIKPVSQQANGRLVSLPKTILLDDEALFALGYYIGDGHAYVGRNKGRYVSFAGHQEQKTTHIARCEAWCARLGVNSTMYHNRQDKGCELRAYSGEFANWVVDHFGRVLTEKRLSQWIFKTSIAQRRAFLSGWLAADGYQRPSKSGNLRYEIITASDRLAADATRLLMSVGQKPCVIYGKHAGAYTIGWTENQDMSLVVTSITHRTCNKIEKVYDLTVEDAETFVIGSAVVHNCHRIGQRDSVTIWYLIAQGTIEERICKLLDNKRKVLSRVLDGGTVEDGGGIFESLLEEIKGEKDGL